MLWIAVELFACWEIFHNFCRLLIFFQNFLYQEWSSADIFEKMKFFKKIFRNTIRVSNSLDPDKAGHFVGSDLDLNDKPDLVVNCLTV